MLQGSFAADVWGLSLNLSFSSGVVFLNEDWNFKVEDNLRTPIFGFLLESALEMNKLAFFLEKVFLLFLS